MWPNLFFIELSEVPNSFVKIGLVLEIKVVFGFIKTRFVEFKAEQKCIKMQKRSILKGATNCNCCFNTNFAVFKIEVCGKLFKHYL